MKYFELTLRTFLIILATILTLQYAKTVPLKTILIIFAISVVVTLINILIFRLLEIDGE